MKALKSISLATLIIICGFIFIYRMNNVTEKEIAWDILGYYLYLPATFIYDQPMLNDYTWLKEINAQKDLTGTLYQVSTNDEGEPMYFFLMGMSMLYLPFFLIGHWLAGPLGFPADGFSTPYQYALVVGGIIYAIIGLIYLRKNLWHFFSETTAALVMLVIVFATNYIHHNTLKNLETVNMLFMLVNIILWNTIKWHEKQKFKYLLAIGLASVLTALVKPSEVFVILIPLLWNVTGWRSLKEKIGLFLKNYKSLLAAIGVSLLLALPQLLYWYFKTGHLFYDSYKNPGVGLDVFSPHIFNVLFSYRKGWFLYTPAMIFAIIGFYFMFKDNRKIFFASAGYFLISFYIISSWTEWWYGAAYSGRPMITLYPVLALSLGYFIDYIRARKLLTKMIFGLFLLFFVFMNLFQWWQMKHYILDPYRTTKDYYWSIFLKTKITDEDRAKMSIYRDFSGKMEFNDTRNYLKFIILDDDFESPESENILSDSNNSFYRLKETQEFYLMFEAEYRELTSKDHAWVKASIDVRYPEGFEGPLPCFVMTMERKDGSYRYFAPEMKSESSPNTWFTLEWDYLTPEIRERHDRFKCYIWKRGKSSFDIDNVRLELYKKK